MTIDSTSPWGFAIVSSMLIAPFGYFVLGGKHKSRPPKGARLCSICREASPTGDHDRCKLEMQAW
jgi:hypothetical protein